MEFNAVREQKNQSCMRNKPGMSHHVITNPTEIPLGGITKSKTEWHIWNNWLLVGYLFLVGWLFVSFWKPLKRWRIHLDNCKHLNPILLYFKKPRDRSKERMVVFKEMLKNQNKPKQTKPDKMFLVLTNICLLKWIEIFWFVYITE